MIKKLDRTSGTSLWRQIANLLTNQIDKGELGIGDKVPTELALAKTYDVNRHTIRQALNHLATEGLIRIERGRGTFVQGRARNYALDPMGRHTLSLLSQGLDSDHEILSQGTMKADENQAKGLDVRIGSELAFVESVGQVKNDKVMLSRSFFPLERCPDILEKITRLNSLIDAFCELGHKDVFNTKTRLTAELPNHDLATKLQIARSRPVLKLAKLHTSTKGAPLAFSLTYFAGDLCQLTFDNRKL